MSSPSIAIIGSGPGGLTLASLLHRASIPYTIFDLRPRPTSSGIETPSGSLDLHEESGILALKACGLYEKFLSQTRDDGEHTIVRDKRGKIWHQDQGSFNPNERRPEIDRNRLSWMLMETLDGDAVKWEHKLLSVTPSTEKSGSWTLTFQSQTPQTFDFVVGADGAWSRVRSVLTDAKPEYSGVSCITLTTPNVDTSNPEVSETVGRGNLFSCSDGKALMSQRGGLEGDYIRSYCMLSVQNESFLSEEGFLSSPIEEIQTKLISDPRFYADWDPTMQAIIRSASTSPSHFEAPRPLYHLLSSNFEYQHKPTITLLGDAAHLQTPFAGEGVNSAMLDALELFNCISMAQKHGRWEVVTRKYEVKMWKRAREVAEMTLYGKDVIFRADAPKGLVELMNGGEGWLHRVGQLGMRTLEAIWSW